MCARRLVLFAVSDGMGGHNAGEVVSALALDELAAALRGEMPHVLTRAIAAHDAIAVDTFTTRIETDDVFLLCSCASRASEAPRAWRPCGS